MDLGSRKKLVKMLVGYLNEITGPKAKFILILCASSGMVEKAINPGKMGKKTILYKFYICMQDFSQLERMDCCIFLFQFPSSGIEGMNWKGSLIYSTKIIKF